MALPKKGKAPAANNIIFAAQILEIRDFVLVNWILYLKHWCSYHEWPYYLGASQIFRTISPVYCEKAVAHEVVRHMVTSYLDLGLCGGQTQGMVMRTLAAEGCSARGGWALVILNQYSDFTGSELWNAKTRGSGCLSQGQMVQEDDLHLLWRQSSWEGGLGNAAGKCRMKVEKG